MRLPSRPSINGWRVTSLTSTASLSLEQAPPISVPFRFFLTAPLFLLLASLLLMLEGAAVLMDRWSPLTLSMTHLFTLGVLGQVMMGAMLQMLPVLAGSPVPRVVPVGHHCASRNLARHAGASGRFPRCRSALDEAGGVSAGRRVYVLHQWGRDRPVAGGSSQHHGDCDAPGGARAAGDRCYWGSIWRQLSCGSCPMLI